MKNGGFGAFSRLRQRRTDDIVLQNDLEALGYTRWKFAALLYLFKRVERHRAAP